MQKNFDVGLFNTIQFLHCMKIDVTPVPEKLSQALLVSSGWRTLVESEFSWTLFFKMREF